jgi:hypothetical protein
MKIAAMAAAAVVLAGTVLADEVTVYVRGETVVPLPELHTAQRLTNEIFASAGVKIDWRSGEPSCSRADCSRTIVVEMDSPTAPGMKPGALAYALPYEGVHNHVFCDRVRESAPEGLEEILLAHVLAHEIAMSCKGRASIPLAE